MATKSKEDLQSAARKRISLTVIAGIAAVYIAWIYAPIQVPLKPSLVDRLVFTLRWLALSVIPIIIGIRLVGNVRFDNIDKAGVVTTTPYAEELVRLRQRALQNTLEQTALHVPIMLIFSTYLDLPYLKLVPIIICLFVFGRIIYYIGYVFTGDQFNRGYGFALTFFSSMIPLVYCLYRLVMGGANYGLSGA
ncbi:transmembrane protein 79-like [Acanthaster planci]|uniref:Transmembrane protein 79-like n=1 Tax=Acanthaster planci TaxID=133434 RepID=A0A8B7XPR0_ACAPL|nr:transmembrane protein 79-like [Acanthaster planci]XP_022082808.1 transmembrane protein 79-like [Acanthaster planci]XP_022082809.1 transmembrane protein 79-like [Acanthaster planci]XP_022082811.1 transmembrane protein 79-like [Acanthaster planci]XP_022082812.1 transmembrane protein 79-like [Acanthaster planci]XP_022082813.1 transmembrane protein 79-like [Acanthaster planci]